MLSDKESFSRGSCVFYRKVSHKTHHIKSYISNSHNIFCSYLFCKNCGLIFADSNLYQDGLDFDFSKKPAELTEDDMVRFTQSFKTAINITDSNGTLYPNYNYNHNAMITDIFNRVNEKLIIFGPFNDKRDLRVLEIGCATGFLLSEIRKNYPNCTVLGIDPSPISSEKAGHLYGIKVICGTIDSVNLNKKKFDVIIMLGNLMLHSNPVLTLEKIRGLMREDSLLIFDTKNPLAAARLLAKFISRIPILRSLSISKALISRSYYGMRFGLTKQFLITSLEDIGFKIMSLQTRSPRLVAYSNDSSFSHGLYGIIWNMLDFLDLYRDERAWIEVCCKIDK